MIEKGEEKEKGDREGRGGERGLISRHSRN